MAGFFRVDEDSGEVINLLYEYPFMVRGTPKKPFAQVEQTVASFQTKEQAEEFLQKWEVEYKKGPNGFASLHIENWNE
jgi:hypothetical protein